VSLAPSIGNWALACRSHYWIREGEIRWSRRYSDAEIADNRERDRRRLDETIPDAAPTALAKLRRRLDRWRR